MATFKDVITKVRLLPIPELLTRTITKVVALPFVRETDESTPPPAPTLLTQTITLTSQDVANGNVTLPFTPTHPEDTVFTPYGCIPQVYALDYTITGNQLSWAGLGAEEMMVSGEPFTLQYSQTDMQEDTISVTSQMLSSKQVTLTSSPTQPSKTLVIPLGCIPQVYATDFSVAGNVLNWSGLGMDGLLQSGDTLRVQYFT